MPYIVYDLVTNKRSAKVWKTYQGALNNSGKTGIVLSEVDADRTIDWMKRHPEWTEERLATLDNL